MSDDRPVDGVTSTGAPVRVAEVALTVRDLDSVSAFYRAAVGLEVLDSAPDRQTLGAGSRTLVELRREPNARPDDGRSAGLFHTAFLLPDRGALASWMAHAIRSDVAVEGASDHLVSEAFYLSDPEGNGVEIYADRPSREWRRRDGMIEMATAPLDLESLAASGTRDWDGAPDGTVVGHVHLRVGDTTAAERFYMDALGLDLACRYPGGSFFGWGGYHHHIAANVWRSRGAGPRPAGSSGLAGIGLVADGAAFDAIRARLGAQQDRQDALAVQDPWGLGLTVRRAA